MLKIIKWLVYGFIFIFLWQISQVLDDNREQMSDATLRLSNSLENSAQDIIKQGQKSIEDTQKKYSGFGKTSQPAIHKRNNEIICVFEVDKR